MIIFKFASNLAFSPPLSILNILPLLKAMGKVKVDVWMTLGNEKKRGCLGNKKGIFLWDGGNFKNTKRVG